MALLLPLPAAASIGGGVRKKPHPLLSRPKLRNFSIRSSQEDPSSSTTSNSAESTVPPPPPGKTTATSAGVGFGSSIPGKSDATSQVDSKKKQKGKKERATIIRRAPLGKPNFASEKEDIQTKERSQNESAFLLAWIGLGALIIFEGVVLAASGFLPEEWDNFFVKYLYPSFTPTVFFFVAGTTAYGVLKYLQNEKPKSDG